MCGREFRKPCGKLHDSPGRQLPAFVRAECGPRDSCPLTGDPVQMPESERGGFAPRAAARDRDAYTTVRIHAQQIPPGPLVSDEIKLDRGFGSFRPIAEWKPELHGDRIPYP